MTIRDMNFLIVGPKSMLGASLVSELCGRAGSLVTTTRKESDVSGPHSLYLDLASPPSTWPEFGESRPDVAFLLAAVTSQHDCQKNPELARLVNVTHTVEMARRLVDLGARIVFPSSNLVYDGNISLAAPDLPYSPRALYGRLKAEAEGALLSLQGEVAVLRLPKVLAGDNPLVAGWRRSLQAGEPIDAFSDLLLAPVSVGLATTVCVALGETRGRGIYQVSSYDEVSYAELARMVAERVGAPEGLVHEITSVQAGATLEHLPDHVTLDGSRVQSEFGIKMPSVLETMKEIL